MDGVDGNGGGGGWHTGASTVDGCDGRRGADGWPAGESIDDAWNKTNVGGGYRWTPTGYTSDCNSLGLEKGNLEATPRCSRGVILPYLENISVTCIHMNKMELLVPNSKIQKHKIKQL